MFPLELSVSPLELSMSLLGLSMSYLELSMSLCQLLCYMGMLPHHYHGNMSEQSVLRGIFSIRNFETVMRLRYIISECVQRRCITVLMP
jgi:hypothetical protein